MQLKLPWVQDPISKLPSVSLTNLVISILFLVTMGILQSLGKVESTGISMEYFGISSALYFGRRLNLNGKSFSSEKKQKEET